MKKTALLLSALIALSPACGSGGSTGEDAGADTTTDPEDDAAVDTAVDTAPPDTPADPPDEEAPVGADMGPDATVVFLHHSTGGCIWNGGVADWFSDYNSTHGTSYAVTEAAYPSSEGYGWANYPYDYWSIWVEHAGPDPYMTEDTLEILTESYDVIVFKHCFPVSHIVPDTGSPDIASSTKSIENYELQYAALREKMRSFPDNRFIVWTGAALVEAGTNAEEGARARQFFTWVKEAWDEPGDNIFVWDFFELETEGGLYLLDSHASSSTDSHPNDTFSAAAAPLFANRIVNVIRGLGDATSLTGE
jgi:hypothetical protein